MNSLILASASPRRKELLTLAGIPFEIDAPEVDEHCDAGAYEAVGLLAQRKAKAAFRLHPDRFILAADTLVALDNCSLGKPADQEDAARMLRLLSNRTHQVFTGVCIISPDGRIYSGIDASDVTFAALDDRRIHEYILTGEPMDKAGAYALQGRASLWIREVRGSYSGVIGLPLFLTDTLLHKAGFFETV